MKTFELSESEEIDPKMEDQIRGILVEHNLVHAPPKPDEMPKSVQILVHNEGKLVAGLFGRSQWGTLKVKILAVDKKYRREGIGEHLMQRAEAIAIERKCKYIALNTFSFQGVEFYEKLGFQRIGHESDYPSGYERIYYRKKL